MYQLNQIFPNMYPSLDSFSNDCDKILIKIFCDINISISCNSFPFNFVRFLDFFVNLTATSMTLIFGEKKTFERCGIQA